jgi:hypothetical protein
MVTLHRCRSESTCGDGSVNPMRPINSRIATFPPSTYIMDLSAPVDECNPPNPTQPNPTSALFSANLGVDQLETFRSRWRQEIEKARSPLSSRTSGEFESHPAAQPPPPSIAAETSSPRRSQDGAFREKEVSPLEVSPLEVYEGAILAERRGNLSEAVIQYRRAFKVPNPQTETGVISVFRPLLVRFLGEDLIADGPGCR